MGPKRPTYPFSEKFLPDGSRQPLNLTISVFMHTLAKKAWNFIHALRLKMKRFLHFYFILTLLFFQFPKYFFLIFP